MRIAEITQSNRDWLNLKNPNVLNIGMPFIALLQLGDLLRSTEIDSLRLSQWTDGYTAFVRLIENAILTLDSMPDQSDNFVINMRHMPEQYRRDADDLNDAVTSKI
jgi:hypothetical protein